MPILARPLYGLYAERDLVRAAQNLSGAEQRFGADVALTHVTGFVAAQAVIDLRMPDFIVTSYGITGADGGRGGGIDLAAYTAERSPLTPLAFLSGQAPSLILRELAARQVALPRRLIHDTMISGLADVVVQLAATASVASPTAPRRAKRRHGVSAARP